MRKSLLTVLLALSSATLLAADYSNDFEKAALDKVPDDMLVLDGGFGVKEEGGNKFLELPGAPLETFGVLFGPTEPSGLAVGARIQSTVKGRRFPTFAVGLNGVGGFKLQVSPAKKLIELIKGEEVVATAPFTWESGSWTALRLQLRKVKDGEIIAEGKAWKHGEAEPKTWQVSKTERTMVAAQPAENPSSNVSAIRGELPAGRPSVWGMPFSGTAIRFDDLSVTKAN